MKLKLMKRIVGVDENLGKRVAQLRRILALDTKMTQVQRKAMRENIESFERSINKK
jgi:hypothetical protein